MNGNWITTTPTALGMTLLSSLGIYACVVIYTRIAGLRSFSKMAGFDFAMTVAIGSLVASTILTQNPPLLQAMFALACIYALQKGVAFFRQRSSRFSRIVDNEPLLLMEGQMMLRENMRQAQVTEEDIWSKLREANVLDLSQVRAVVLETTGDISVLHGGQDAPPLDPVLLTGVRGQERLRQDWRSYQGR